MNIRVLLICVLMLSGCQNANYNSPKMTFDNPPTSVYDCTVAFSGPPDKMVITCVDKQSYPHLMTQERK